MFEKLNTVLIIAWLCYFISPSTALTQAELFAQYNYPPANVTVVDYSWNITHSMVAPDGKYRSGFAINGQVPGPAITVNEGDWVRVVVNNYLPVDITIHFHGILQHGTPWADGVPGVSQFPILSGDSYTHIFQLVDQYGAAWYHAHYRGYENDGIVGPIYIIPSDDVVRPYEEITADEAELEIISVLETAPTDFIMNDWYKWSMDHIIARTFSYGIDATCIQSIIVNGKGRVVCHDEDEFNTAGAGRLANYLTRFGTPGFFDTMGCLFVTSLFPDLPLSVAELEGLETPGYSQACTPTVSEREIIYTNNQQWVYMNLYNMGGEFNKLFSIDDHLVHLIAVDGTFIHPILTTQVQVPIGGRYSVLVKVDPTEHTDADLGLPFAIRVSTDEFPQVVESISYLVYGSINTTNTTFVQSFTNVTNGVQYQDIGGNLLDTSYNSTQLIDTIPYDIAFTPPSGAADITLNFYLNQTQTTVFSLFRDGTEMTGGMELITPLIYDNALNSSTNFTQEYPVITDVGIELGDVIDLIIDNDPQLTHPIHLHGHYIYIISQSETENFPYATVADAIAANYSELRFDDAPRADVFPVPASGHIVARFVSDNPGFWALHCHIINHQVGGMMTVIAEAKNDIPPVPPFLFLQPHANYTIYDDDISETTGTPVVAFSNAGESVVVL